MKRIIDMIQVVSGLVNCKKPNYDASLVSRILNRNKKG